MNWSKEIGRAIGVRIGGVALATLVAFGSFGAYGPTSAYASEPGTFNLELDADKDGVPDELAAAVSAIETAADQEAAIQDFVNRLPYSKETLDLQAQAETVAAKLMGTEDPKEAEALQAELQSITQQMEADPAFAATKKALETIFEPKPVALESVERSSGEIATRDVGLQGVWWGGLLPGDIMFQRDFAFPPASLLGRLYNHTGNYHGYGQVYESREGGAILKPLSDWQHGFKFVALGYNRWYPFAEPLLRQREAQYGMYGQTPFNFWFPNKWTDSALYCAQLTWKIHLLAGTNLDSNSWQHQLYVASVYGWWAVPLFAIDTVAPDEIADSPYVRIYSADWVIN